MSPGLDMSGLVSCVGGDVLAIWVTACRGLLGRGLGKTTFATYADGWVRDRMLKPRTEGLYLALLKSSAPGFRQPAYRRDPRARGPVASLVELLDRILVRYRAMLLLATFASLRFGELAALRRGDIDLGSCDVRVVRSLVQMDDGRLIDTEPKSRAGLRLVSFPREIAPELRWYLDRFVDPANDSLVFVGPKGGRLRRQNFRDIWIRARDEADLSGVHLHDLRHTGNTMAAATGASLRELMERMGHSSPRAALIYQHATRERDDVIAAAMGEAFVSARRQGASSRRSGTQRARKRRSGS